MCTRICGRLCGGFPAGHSLGGALAQLAAHDMHTKFKHGWPGLWISCYTLGSPRDGNRAFARLFNETGDMMPCFGTTPHARILWLP